MLKKCNNNYRAEKAKEHNITLKENANNGNIKAQKEIIKNFIAKNKLSKDKKDDLFFGKNVCISLDFQKKRFNEFLAIIKRLYEYGATYTSKASACDIFIEYQEGEDEEIRAMNVKQAIETDGKKIQILSLEEGLNALNLAIDDLNKVDHINEKFYSKRAERNKKGKIQNYFDKTYIPMTIGDILKAKGVKI